MRHIYIDESGDIGSKSTYIAFAAIIASQDRQLEKLVKKTWRAKPQYHTRGRLHAVEVDDATRIRILSQLAKLSIVIKVHSFKKKRAVQQQLRQYYSELAKFIASCGEAHIVIIERKDTIKHRSKIITELGLSESFKNIIFGDPLEYKQLQAVDFVAWAYGRKYELHDSTFSDIIEVKHV